jgi:two-component system, NarL family, nitrate/nitrite response regulator NarL
MEPAPHTPAKIRVMVADSSRIHTQLLSGILGRDPDLEVICWDSEPATLIPTAIAHDINVLAVSSNWNANVRDGIEVVREISSATPGTKVVVLVDSQNNEVIIDFLRAGARGIFKKNSSLEMLRKCLHAVHRGEIWIESGDLARVIDDLASIPSSSRIQPKRLENLSQRECQVVDWLVQGLSNREIAQQMGLSQHTIKNYVFRIFEKMGVSNRVELLFFVLSESRSTAPEVSDNTLLQDQVQDVELPVLIEEAKQGSLTAQVALAEAYAKKRRSALDAGCAYKWYLIASERMAEAQAAIAKTLTRSEFEQCEKEAKRWLAETKRNRPSMSHPEAKVLRLKSVRNTRSS